MTDQFSTCCGASSSNPIYSDLSLCPECKEHCGWVAEDEDAPIYQDPVQLGWDRVMIAFTVLAVVSFVAGYASAAMEVAK